MFEITQKCIKYRIQTFWTRVFRLSSSTVNVTFLTFFTWKQNKNLYIIPFHIIFSAWLSKLMFFLPPVPFFSCFWMKFRSFSEKNSASLLITWVHVSQCGNFRIFLLLTQLFTWNQILQFWGLKDCHFDLFSDSEYSDFENF